MAMIMIFLTQNEYQQEDFDSTKTTCAKYWVISLLRKNTDIYGCSKHRIKNFKITLPQCNAIKPISIYKVDHV